MSREIPWSQSRPPYDKVKLKNTRKKKEKKMTTGFDGGKSQDQGVDGYTIPFYQKKAFMTAVSCVIAWIVMIWCCCCYFGKKVWRAHNKDDEEVVATVPRKSKFEPGPISEIIQECE
ncbi:Oidioi.mRNA.OKI2018_I69.PAR.g9889.t1.cds [Oikopleura dioica]|uniref:Oidioi.mRNA.OKI2018_I69.PAR.g9889.t1.cds n=1 Tax=Oikopleura dioica TaxID=34765 RepID=A0ABN7RMU2_OIKDI|nr:Oidioi.mRNA.OKI2018_I69.PAR.g9889.t1.cds [Oikopleura dioica]